MPKQLFIKGPAGKLQASVFLTQDSPQRVGIICHPHPLHSGTMTNKVVTTTAKAMQQQQISTLRFNYRGVDKSEGEYAHAIGEIDDCLAVYQWLQDKYHPSECLLAGFSFGAYIAAKASEQIQPNKLILIAPPVNHFPFDTLSAFHCSTLVIIAGHDEIVPAKSVRQWASSLESDHKLTEFPKASHFFHGQLMELSDTISKFLEQS